MAEGVEKIIRYKIVIDGDDAKAFLDNLNLGKQVNVAGPSKVEPKADDPMLSVVDDLDLMRSFSFQMVSLLDTIVGQLNMLVDCCDQVGAASYSSALAIQQLKIPQQPKPKDEEHGKGVMDMLPRLVALAIGGLGVGAAIAGAATDPLAGFRGMAAGGAQLSAAGGIAGALVGGPWGIAIAAGAAAIAGLATAATQAASALLGVANSLKEFNGGLFATMTAFEYFQMGFKFRLAADVGPAITTFVHQIERLMVALEPLIANVINLLASAIEALIPLLIRMAQSIQAVLASIQFFLASMPVVAASLNQMTGGLFPGTQADATVKLVQAMGALMSPLKSIDAQLQQMMGEGQALALWLFTGAMGFARHGPTMGEQTNRLHWPGDPKGWGQSVPNSVGSPEDLAGFSGAALARRFLHVVTGRGPVEHLAAEQIADKQAGAGDATSGALPRPSPASVSLHVAEGAQITPAEDDRLHAELLEWMNAAMGAIHDMNCGRWQRMRVARARAGDWT